MMNQAAQPRQVESYKPNAQGELDRDDKGKPTGQPTLVDANGEPAKKDTNTGTSGNTQGNDE